MADARTQRNANVGSRDAEVQVWKDRAAQESRVLASRETDLDALRREREEMFVKRVAETQQLMEQLRASQVALQAAQAEVQKLKGESREALSEKIRKYQTFIRKIGKVLDARSDNEFDILPILEGWRLDRQHRKREPNVDRIKAYRP